MPAHSRRKELTGMENRGEEMAPFCHYFGVEYDRARTHEVARMLGGAKFTETSLQHAAQMIAGSQ